MGSSPLRGLEPPLVNCSVMSATITDGEGAVGAENLEWHLLLLCSTRRFSRAIQMNALCSP